MGRVYGIALESLLRLATAARTATVTMPKMVFLLSLAIML